jgi:hypothetical protein
LKKRSERKSNVTVNGLFISIILVFVSNAVAKIIVLKIIVTGIKTQTAVNKIIWHISQRKNYYNQELTTAELESVIQVP